MTENKEIMRQAREDLSGKWPLAIGTFLVYGVIIGGLNGIRYLGPVASLIIGGPLLLGVSMFSLALSRRQDARFEQVFDGFKFFSTAMVTYLWMVLYIILWSLLLIIPGIIAAYRYSQAFYLLADEPTLTPEQALEKSKQMMDGKKAKLFFLGLRFIGWALLCILTLGIGFLWLMPWMYVAHAKFHDDIKGQAASEPVVVTG